MITTNEILVLIHFKNQQREKLLFIRLMKAKHRQKQKHCLLFLGRKISLLSRVETQGWHHL